MSYRGTFWMNKLCLIVAGTVLGAVQALGFQDFPIHVGPGLQARTGPVLGASASCECLRALSRR